MYRGTILKSRDGIPPPLPPPRGTSIASDARIARSRFYPGTIAYTPYALVVLAGAMSADPTWAILFSSAGAICFTLVEYLVHRYVLHGRFPDAPGRLRHALHLLFDASHGDHHLRPWDGRHINGGLSTLPFALVLALASLLAPLSTLPVFVATILLAYVVEEWIHYAVHFHRLPSRYFAYIRRHHHYHHSRHGQDVAFGLSSGVWDVPLGTRIPRKGRGVLPARSPRAQATRVVAMLAIAAACGSVRAEAQGQRRTLAFGTGWFDAVQKDDQAFEGLVEYRMGSRSHRLLGLLAAAVTGQASSFLGAGVGYELALGPWTVTPSFAPGYYRWGEGKDLGWPLEFRSQLELGYRFGGGSRLSVAVSHLSNGGLGRINPGQETFSISLEVPLTRPAL